ncbi:MAG: hypothetical protein ACM3XS_02040 [Bacteroidota bacterium]
MAKMIRKQIYLRPHQDRTLKDMVRDTGVSEAELIRQAVEYRISTAVEPRRDADAWEAEKRFIEALKERYADKKQTGKTRAWKREELHEGR